MFLNCQVQPHTLIINIQLIMQFNCLQKTQFSQRSFRYLKHIEEKEDLDVQFGRNITISEKYYHEAKKIMRFFLRANRLKCTWFKKICQIYGVA